MKEKTYSILVLVIMIAVMALCSLTAKAQDKPYNFKVSAAYTLNQFKFDLEEIEEYIDGYQIDVAGRITGKKTVLYGVANFERKNDVTQLDPETYPILPVVPASSSVPVFDVVRRNTNSLRFGARLSHNFGDTFEPFVSALVGFRASNDVQPKKLERAYQVGGDVNLNRFFVRVAYQFTRVTGNEGVEQGYLFGGGFRF